MYDSRTRLADQVADEVRSHFGDLVLGAGIPRNVRVSEAPGFGQTVITYDPGSRGAIGYLQAAREIRRTRRDAGAEPASSDAAVAQRLGEPRRSVGCASRDRGVRACGRPRPTAARRRAPARWYPRQPRQPVDRRHAGPTAPAGGARHAPPLRRPHRRSTADRAARCRCPARASPSARRRRSRRTRSSRGRSSTRTRWPSWRTRSASSACCSRSSSAPSGDGYELVMGERRLRAAQAAGLTDDPGDRPRHRRRRDAARRAAGEHPPGALNPLEEAAAYQQLLEEFGTTHEELATRIGRSRSQVSNTIRLLNLPVPVQRRVAAGVLSAGHARALLGLDDARRSRTSWPPGSSPRDCRCGPPRSSSRWPRTGTADAARPAAGRRRGSRARRSPTWPTSCPTPSTPGSGSTSAGARARSPSSSPRSTTWSASSRMMAPQLATRRRRLSRAESID